MSVYSEFFLNSKSSVVQLELLEISHNSFSKIYRIVRNAVNGVTIPLIGTFEYYPLKIRQGSTQEGNLDTTINVDLGDLGDVVGAEIDRALAAVTMTTKPQFRYWTYREDNLDTPLYGPVQLEITTISMTREGVSFQAISRQFNLNKTGEAYTFDRFPMLRTLL